VKAAKLDLSFPFWEAWPTRWCYALLAAATLVVLLPFSGRAFHIDDTLFIWAAQQIAKHPLDPYGFQVVWYTHPERMADVTQNPPLASYYAALAGKIAGWSERSLHLAFILPAIAVTLGTYRLAGRFTRLRVLAAALALMTPATLICASSVMCDTLMLALSLWAIIFWLEGLGKGKGSLLILAALLLGASALTKYFAVSFIPLLFVYSLQQKRRLGNWAWYLLIPVAMLAGYDLWTGVLYGHGLLSGAASYATTVRTNEDASTLGRTWGALAFVGGSMLPALTFSALLWRRRPLIVVAFLTILNGFGMGWFNFAPLPETHWLLISIQLTLFIASGISVLALAIQDVSRWRDAYSVFLLLWVLGTFIFAGFVNWTTNVRSVLPLIPAAAILLARRLELTTITWDRKRITYLSIAFAATLIPSLWVAGGDAASANAGREAARLIRDKTAKATGTVWFEGHWGFQYYMQLFGAQHLDVENDHLASGDYLAIALDKSTSVIGEPDPASVASRDEVSINLPLHVATSSHELGAGCYSSFLGPLPFAFGPVEPQTYELFRLNSKLR
jgi:4-amino-4-deoxy-L-arabinose transferase-like glycosyltransferase